MKSVLQEIPVDSLKLDLENPRLYSNRIVKEESLLTDEQLHNAIVSETDAFNSLYRAIKRAGIRDPIWVKEDSDGKYVVIEGNRRTTVLRTLLEEDAEAPDGVSWTSVPAHVIDDSVSELEIKLQKVRLQSGKKAWGVVNDAAVVHEFHFEERMGIEDIADEMQISKTKVKKLLKSFKLYLEYARETGDTNEKRFSMFNEVPVKIIDWIEESPRNKADYHKWISPVDGPAKIRAARTGRQSATEFAKCLDTPEAIELLREDPDSTIEDAIEVVKENDVLKDMTFLKRILPLSKSLNEMDETQLAKLANEKRLVVHLRSLKNACEQVLNDIENMEEI